MKPLHLLLATCLLWLGASAGAQAQTVYRIVGSDGRVTFSDQAPHQPGPATVSTTNPPSAGAVSGAAANQALPFALRQPATRYPVTLYSAPDCSVCNAGRALLNGRGIPFTERSVTSADDVAALKRLSGEAVLPFLTLGGQPVRGYSEPEWSQYLDAAGYPKSSVLPSGYRQAPATALVSTEAPTAAKAETRTDPRTDPRTGARPPVPAAANNPAGIQF